MFKQTFLVQWKWTRNALLAMSILVMIVPAVALRLGANDYYNPTPATIINISNISGYVLALFAIITGIVVQDASWRQDVNGKYIYALSMPVPWQELLVRRVAAGMILLLIPALFALLGGGIAASLLELPSTLHAYPFGVAVRYFLASVLAYAMWSILVRLSGERASLVVLLLLLAVPMAAVSIEVFHLNIDVTWMSRVLTSSPSPLAVFFSRWALIDV
jgi:hypothetical protein